MPRTLSNLRMAFPSNVCFGERLDGETQIRNTSDCAGEFRMRFQPSNMSEEVTDTVRLASGQSATFPFEIPNFPGNTVNLTEVLELRVGENDFRQLGTRENQIDPQFPNFQLVSAPYPGNTQPGDPVSANLTIQNSGPCSGTAQLDGTQIETQEFNLTSGQTANFNHQFSMPGGEQPINLSLTDVERDVTADQFETLVEPSQAVIIDKNEGKVEMVGGFATQLRYAGTIQGANIEGESLETSDKLAAGQRVGTFSGTVSTSPSDSDIIKFDNLDFLNMQFGSNTQWVLDGEIMGEAESFQYSEYPIGMTENLLPIQAEDPEISVRASPTDRLGRVRRRAGFNRKVISSAFFRRVRRA